MGEGGREREVGGEKGGREGGRKRREGEKGGREGGREEGMVTKPIYSLSYLSFQHTRVDRRGQSSWNKDVRYEQTIFGFVCIT